MGTILASAMISSVRTGMIADPDADWFSDSVLLGFLNRAERHVLLVRPELYTVRTTLALAAGSQQTLAASATALLDIYKNVVSKRRCRQTSRAMLEHLDATWTADSGVVDALHWTHDTKDRLRFEVYPPNDGTGQLDLLQGAVPDAIPSTASAINLNDVFETPLLFLVASYCFSIDTEKRDTAKAVSYENRAMAQLGVNAQIQLGLSPKPGQPGGG